MMKSKILSLMLATVTLPRAFENDAGWKMDGDKIALQDGNPVWMNADGSESVLKHDTLNNLRTEAQTWRTRAEENLNKLKSFEGIDATKAREALEKIGKIDQKTLIDSGKVDEVRNSMKAEYDSQISEKDKAFGELQGKFNGMVLDMAFSSSDFIRDNVAIPAEMFRSFFGQQFKVVDGKIEAFAKDGNRLMSKKNIGEFADFNEAIEILVDSYPQKDAILKAPDHRGTGNKGNGSNNGTGAVIRRAEFETWSPQKQAEAIREISAGKLRLVD